MDKVILVLPKAPKEPVKRRDRERVVGSPRGLYRPTPKGVRILVSVPRNVRSVQVNRVTAVAKLSNECLNGNADPVQNGERTVREHRNAERLHNFY